MKAIDAIVNYGLYCREAESRYSSNEDKAAAAGADGSTPAAHIAIEPAAHIAVEGHQMLTPHCNSCQTMLPSSKLLRSRQGSEGFAF